MLEVPGIAGPGLRVGEVQAPYLFLQVLLAGDVAHQDRQPELALVRPPDARHVHLQRLAAVADFLGDVAERGTPALHERGVIEQGRQAVLDDLPRLLAEHALGGGVRHDDVAAAVGDDDAFVRAAQHRRHHVLPLVQLVARGEQVLRHAVEVARHLAQLVAVGLGHARRIVAEHDGVHGAADALDTPHHHQPQQEIGQPEYGGERPQAGRHGPVARSLDRALDRRERGGDLQHAAHRVIGAVASLTDELVPERLQDRHHAVARVVGGVVRHEALLRERAREVRRGWRVHRHRALLLARLERRRAEAPVHRGDRPVVLEGLGAVDPQHAQVRHPGHGLQPLGVAVHGVRRTEDHHRLQAARDAVGELVHGALVLLDDGGVLLEVVEQPECRKTHGRGDADRQHDRHADVAKDAAHQRAEHVEPATGFLHLRRRKLAGAGRGIHIVRKDATFGPAAIASRNSPGSPGSAAQGSEPLPAPGNRFSGPVRRARAYRTVAVRPPSTTNSAPVTYFDSSEAK